MTEDGPAYAELQCSKAVIKSEKQERSSGPTRLAAYAEVVHQPVKRDTAPAQVNDGSSKHTAAKISSVAAAEQTSHKPATHSSNGDNSRTTGDPLYCNVPTSHSYENVPFTGTPDKTKAKTEKTFYKVTKNYVPNTSHSQGLAVEQGDVVQAQTESGNRVYCLLCAKDTRRSNAFPERCLEGWLPLDILVSCRPDVVYNPATGVPVVKSHEVESTSPSERAAAPKSKTKPREKQQEMIKSGEQSKSTTDGDTIAYETYNPSTDVPVVKSQDVKSSSPSQKAESKPKAKPRLKNPEMMESVQSKSTAECDMVDYLRARVDETSPVPVMPVCLSPKLTVDRQLYEEIEAVRGMLYGESVGRSDGDKSDHSSTAIHVVAVANYMASEAGALSFTRGSTGELIYASDARWWCVRLDKTYGWVPGDYWRIVTDDGRIIGGEGPHGAPWMTGKLNRVDCEQLLMRRGRERDFVVRESAHLAGQYALSIRRLDRVHHFPIQPTSDGKFYIGKHSFKTMHNVIIYYRKNTLFVDETGRPVTLGQPFSTGYPNDRSGV